MILSNKLYLPKYSVAFRLTTVGNTERKTLRRNTLKTYLQNRFIVINHKSINYTPSNLLNETWPICINLSRNYYLQL